MSRAAFLIGIVVFAAGAFAGALGAQVANPAPPAAPWPSLATVDEPAAARNVAEMLLRDDARGLARTLDTELLQRLGKAVDPLVDVDSVTFTGATERQGDILAAYVAGGRTQQGEAFLAGIVFRVRGGKVVGVN